MMVKGNSFYLSDRIALGSKCQIRDISRKRVDCTDLRGGFGELVFQMQANLVEFLQSSWVFWEN